MWWYPDRRLIRAVAQPGTGSQYPVGSPVRLVILVQPPATARTTVAMAPAIVVGFMDIYGNVVSGAGITVSVTASMGTVSGTTSVQATAAGASFSNLIFDDIANTIISNRTLTFAAAGFTSAVSMAVTVVKGSLQLWMEADYGVVDANGAALTSWADRSATATAMTTAPAKTAPVFRVSGFGGIAGLSYWEFGNAHGMQTPQLAALALTSSTEFYVVQRSVGDANCCISFVVSTDALLAGIQDTAASAYISRWNAGHTILLQSSYTQATWIPKGSRQLIRQEYDGTHAGHKLFLNGVQQALPDQFVDNPGTPVNTATRVQLGYRDVALPALDLDGQYAAALVFTPKLTTPEAQSVETYLQKWMGGAPALPPAPQRGPILLANSVIDGVTIQVLNWSASADIKSIDTQLHTLIFLFSQPIKRFAATLNAPGSIPGGLFKMLLGVNNYQSIFNFSLVTNNSYSANGQRVQIDDTVTGFTAVILRDSVTPGNTPTPFGDSILQNCRFSIMSDP